MIRALKEREIHGLNRLPPTEWKFDYEDFLRDYLTEDFFNAFVMVQNEKLIGTGNVFFKEKIGWLILLLMKNIEEKDWVLK